MVKSERRKRVIWQKIAPYFTEEELGPTPEKISGMLLMILFDLRFHSGWAIEIHSVMGGKHCENSYHYQGLAVDFHFQTPNGSFTFREQAKYLQRYLVAMQLDNFTGLGAYPEWRHPGFHLDVRGKKARWLRQRGKYLDIQRFD